MRWETHSEIWETTGALILSAVDEKGRIYRRIGWLQAMNDYSFERELQTITLI